MNDDLLPKRPSRRDFLVSTSAAAAGWALFDLELNHKRNVVGMLHNPCCFYQHKGFLYIPDLASRVTILDADDNLAAQLGDGKETDGKTNRPDCQTDPALFAAPHALTVDSKGSFYAVEWIATGRPRKFKHVPA
jgi:peptidylamidoglycolate lyase